ncbi:hypothetical protein [Priestia flexa]|uniref:hypothetical protein n=1 Tax=Priestia flexa TaxID=86664 RepID=UPI0004737641|nr:hypothetical protein [Priestia flexa]
MSFTLSTNAMYIDSKFEQVKEKLKEIFTTIREHDMFILIEANDSEVVIHDSYHVIFENDLSLEELDFAVTTLENIIGEVLKGFKFKIPDNLLNYRIESTLRKYGKIKEEEGLLFSDRECIKDLIKLFKS